MRRKREKENRTTVNHIFYKHPHRFSERRSVLSGEKTNTQVAYFKKWNEAHPSNYSLNQRVFLNLKWISCRQCIVRSVFISIQLLYIV